MSGGYDLTYDVTSLRIFSAATKEGNMELEKEVFGYLKKYPKRGYAINNQQPTINMDYNKVDTKMDYCNQY